MYQVVIKIKGLYGPQSVELELSNETKNLLKSSSGSSLNNSTFKDKLNQTLSTPPPNNSTEDKIEEDDDYEDEDKTPSVTYTNTQENRIILKFNGRYDTLQSNIDDLTQSLEDSNVIINYLK